MAGIEVLGSTVGPVGENSFTIFRTDSDRAIMVDPGDEADRLLQPLAERGLTLEAILLTHCHFDHIGAVAPVARATAAPPAAVLEARRTFRPLPHTTSSS